MLQKPETIGEAMLLYVKQNHGTQARAAIAWNCSTTMLSEVIRGTRRPTERMLMDLDYRHIEAWLPRAIPLPTDALPLSIAGASETVDAALPKGNGSAAVKDSLTARTTEDSSAVPHGAETINIVDDVRAQYERTLDDAGVTKRNVPQLCRYGQPSPDFANQPCDCPPDACRLGRNAGVEVSAQPKGK